MTVLSGKVIGAPDTGCCGETAYFGTFAGSSLSGLFRTAGDVAIAAFDADSVFYVYQGYYYDETAGTCNFVGANGNNFAGPANNFNGYIAVGADNTGSIGLPDLGVGWRRWSAGWFGPTGLFSGRLSLTNLPGEGLPYVELRSTNGNSYTKLSRVSDVWKPTNYIKLSITNPVAGQVLKFASVSYSGGEASIVLTNDTDLSGGAGSGILTNANQFGAAGNIVTIKDGVLLTNGVTYGLTNNGDFSNSSKVFIGGFLDAKGPNTNRVQLNLPHLTVSRSAIINAQGDLTNSDASSNWSLYGTNLLLAANGLNRNVQYNNSGTLWGSNDVSVNFSASESSLIVSNGAGVNTYLILSRAVGGGRNYYTLVAPDSISWTNNTQDFIIQANAANSIIVKSNANLVPGLGTPTLGTNSTPWSGIFATRIYQGAGANALSSTQRTNATADTNVTWLSVFTPVAGQVRKFHSVTWDGSAVAHVVETNVDPATLMSILTNANQFGASVTLTIKDYSYLTNMTDWATSRVQNIIVTNTAYVRAGQSESNGVVGGLLYKKVTIPANTNLNTTIGTFTNAGQFIIRGHTMTNDGDSVITKWRGRILAGTNSFKLVYGYETALATGSFTNTDTAFEAGMEVTRTASVGGLVHAYVNFVGAIGSLTAEPGSYISTNWVLSCTNGAHVTNVLQIASNRAGCISNNFMRVDWEPASR
jgi:hypothetical protein